MAHTYEVSCLFNCLLAIKKDIKIAETLPADFYKNESIFEVASWCACSLRDTTYLFPKYLDTFCGLKLK